MNVDAVKADHRESTSAFDLWRHGDRFLSAARKLGTDHLPALYLACHATELALKSHLRANGYAMSDLASREIGHRIGVALSDLRAMCAGDAVDRSREPAAVSGAGCGIVAQDDDVLAGQRRAVLDESGGGTRRAGEQAERGDREPWVRET